MKFRVQNVFKDTKLRRDVDTCTRQYGTTRERSMLITGDSLHLSVPSHARCHSPLCLASAKIPQTQRQAQRKSFSGCWIMSCNKGFQHRQRADTKTCSTQFAEHNFFCRPRFKGRFVKSQGQSQSAETGEKAETVVSDRRSNLESTAAEAEATAVADSAIGHDITEQEVGPHS